MSIFSVLAIIFFVVGSIFGLNGLFSESDRLLNLKSGIHEFIIGIGFFVMAGIFRFIGKSKKPKYARQYK